MAAQFDLYRSRSGALLVILQADFAAALPTRVIAPCQPAGASTNAGRLTPAFWFAEREYRVMIPLLGTSRLPDLGTRIGTITHLRDEIIRAVDLLLTGV